MELNKWLEPVPLDPILRAHVQQIRKKLGLTGSLVFDTIPNSAILLAFLPVNANISPILANNLKTTYGYNDYEALEVAGDRILEDITRTMINSYRPSLNDSDKERYLGFLKANITLLCLAQRLKINRDVIPPADKSVLGWKVSADVIEALIQVVYLATNSFNLVYDWFLRTFNYYQLLLNLIATGKTQCAVDGEWGEWSQWSRCSNECGAGMVKRERSCDNPEPETQGDPKAPRGCTGVSGQSKSCFSDTDCTKVQNEPVPAIPGPPGLMGAGVELPKHVTLPRLYSIIWTLAYEYNIGLLSKLLETPLSSFELYRVTEDERIKYALWGALDRNNIILFNTLIIKYNVSPQLCLEVAIEAQNLNICTQLMESVDYDLNSDGFQSALSAAAKAFNEGLIDYLITLTDNWTGLYYGAGYWGSMELIQYLIKLRPSRVPDINAGLDGAAKGCQIELAEYFMMQKPSAEFIDRLYREMAGGAYISDLHPNVSYQIRDILAAYLNRYYGKNYFIRKTRHV